MTTDTNKTTPVAEPASEPPHRLDSWATECSEPATDKDHLPVAPASAADGLPEPVARLLRWCGPSYMQVPHDGLAARTFAEFPLKESTSAHAYWKDGALLYSADQMHAAIAAERELRMAAEERQALYLALTRDAQDIAAEAQALLSTLRQKHDDALTLLVTLRQHLAEAVRALDYYRAAFRRERPAYVPATIRLLHDVRGDAPLGHRSVARAGKHECECNQFGAVSVRAEDGHMLGIRPAEFEPVTWRAA